MKNKTLLTIVVIVFSIFALGAVSASAATTGTYGKLTYSISNGEATITDCNESASGDIVIPDTLGGYPVTSIGSSAFSSCSRLTSITIPDSVTNIGAGAFYYCSSLESIRIPDSVTSIGSLSFYKCISLERITIPDRVIRIGDNAFYGCSSLESIRIPDSVTSIGAGAFCSCWDLTRIIIPDGVTGIGDGVFSDCRRLASITIPDSVTSIGESAFYGCSNLASITIPDSVTSIGNYAFENCSSLTSITIPDSVTSIGEEAFYKCSSLERITIPDSVTSIGDDAFYECSSLTKVDITDLEAWCNIEFASYCSNPLFSLGELYLNGNLVTDITIPNSVTSIGHYAFYECSSLTSITIPDSVTSIGYYAFYGCGSLTKVNYNGNSDNWSSISIGRMNDTLAKATKNYFWYVNLLSENNEEYSYTCPAGSVFDFTIIPEKTGYITKICVDEALTTEFDITTPISENIDLYLYFEEIYLNKIELRGTASAMPGGTITQSAIFATDKEAAYMSVTVKYPEYLNFKSVSSPDFAEASKGAETVKDGFKYLDIACIYDYNGGLIEKNKNLVPFEIELEVATDAPIGEVAISIEKVTLMGSSNFEITDITNNTLSINPKLVERIEITGDSKIDKPTKYTALVLPDYTSDKSVIWTVDEEDVATVSEDGVLTPLLNGTVIITVTAKDGSGVFATKEVEVVAYAKIDNIDFGAGISTTSFSPDNREYTVYVDEDATSITLTPTHSVQGVVRPNGSGLWFSGMPMVFDLTEEETVITLNRELVDRMTSSIYTVKVVKLNTTRTEVVEDKRFEITVNPTYYGKTVILSLYNGEQLAEVQSKECVSDKLTFTTDKAYTNAKVMVWDGLTAFKPACVVETVK